MIRRALALAAASLALATGCNKGSAGPAFRLAEPSSVALFNGYAQARTTADGVDLLWPYVAVANSAQDELLFFDPVDDKVAPAPIDAPKRPTAPASPDLATTINPNRIRNLRGGK